jgi:hypothetical protein
MSAFKRITARFYVDLPLCQLGGLREAAKLQISERLLKFDADLQATVLAYRDIRPLAPTMRCYADHPFCHVAMQGEFLVFKPLPGARLPAAVTFVSQAAVSLQVFEHFQAFVDVAELRARWTFARDEWAMGPVAFRKGDTVIVEVADARPAQDGVAMQVRILRRAESVPPAAAAGDDDRLA